MIKPIYEEDFDFSGLTLAEAEAMHARVFAEVEATSAALNDAARLAGRARIKMRHLEAERDRLALLAADKARGPQLPHFLAGGVQWV